jgi:UDP-N-acetylglucosamine:LPS N-acetylglucosamine transferase
VFAYQENLAPLFCAADIVVSRAGAGAIFEINFFEKKCVLIPLQTKQTNHQLDNARAYAKQHPTRTWLCTNDQEVNRELIRLINEHANTRN